MTDLLRSVSDAAQAELLDRAAERGFLLRSELYDVDDPLVHGGGAVAELEQEAADLGIPVVDDLGHSPDTEAGADDRERGLTGDPVGDYLARATRVGLLDAQQEADLAKRYRAGDAARERLESEGRLDDATRDRLEAVRRDGERAFDRMIAANLRLVIPTARKYVGEDLPFIEAIQEGNLGLIRAVQKFDPTKGYKFSTYAVWWIRQAIQRSLSGRSRLIRLPGRVWEQASRIRRAEAALRHDHGRDPSDEDVAAAAGLPPETVAEVRALLRPVRSLDLPVGDDGGVTFGSLIPDPDAPDPLVTTEVADARARVVDALRRLPERERAIVELRYGLRDGTPRSLGEITQVLDLSRERIRQLERQALDTLRDEGAEEMRTLSEALTA